MFQSPTRELSLAVVGLAFPNPDKSDRRFEAELCAPGDPVALVREPKNRFDPRAVAVFSERGVQLGYLTAERCGWIGSQLARGAPIDAIFQEISGKAAIIRVCIGGGSPRLPANDIRHQGSSGDDDFMPDPPAPDWGA